MWYQKSLEEIFKTLHSSLSGLTNQQVEENQKKYGYNVLEKNENDSIFKIVFRNILEPLTLILIGVIIICTFIQEYKEVIIISVIIIINIIISTIQEVKAQKALDSLENLVASKSVVIRNNKTIEIDSSDLCVGDIIILEAGNYIPADIRLIEDAKLYVDESTLTGESNHIEKDSNFIGSEDTLLAERKNMLYSATFITNGRAKGIVVAVGKDSEIGKIAAMLNRNEKMQTPLQKRLAQLSKYVSIFAFIIAIIIFLLSYLINHIPLDESFLIAITLAVAVIPECLPVIVSIILALSVTKMAKNNAIIKKLPSVESLGSVDIICTDKTGTLTLNKMSVTDYFIGIQPLNSTPLSLESQLIKAMALCNDSFVDHKGAAIGDPTELALTYFVHEYGLNVLEYRSEHYRSNEIPFDSDRKLMSTINRFEDQEIVYTKGSIDQLLERTPYYLDDNNNIKELNADDKKLILKNANKMSSQALRVLGFAYKPLKENEDIESNLIFIGAVGMIDPVKEEALIAVNKAKKAGIKTVMITGDHPSTAFAIGKKLGLANSEKEVITGRELEKMSDENLSKNALNYSIYSRVSPEHKVRIVKTLQNLDKTVSMTGDGVNDAPSLQTAHIGVAMGITGSDVAKQASSMILMDDNIGTVVYAVEEGRNIYNKIKRAIEFVLGTNFGEVLGIMIAILLGLASPLGAIHVLWINLIVESLIAIPISMDVNDESVMKEKPRPKKESIFANIKLPIALIALFTGLCMFFGYYIVLENSHDLLSAQSVAFAIMSIAPMIYVLSIRSPHKNIFISKPWQNPILCLAIVIGILLNIVLIYTPLNSFFRLTAITGLPLLITIIGILLPTIGYEIYKAIRNVNYRKNLNK